MADGLKSPMSAPISQRFMPNLSAPPTTQVKTTSTVSAWVTLLTHTASTTKSKSSGSGTTSSSKHKTHDTDTTTTKPKTHVADTPPPKSKSSGTGTKTKSKSGNYTVKKGDSLERISRNSGTSVSAIKKANGMSGELIHPGQTLVVPK